MTLNPVGVAVESGVLEFGFEPTGRYGGIGLDFPEKLEVEVKEAETVLSQILAERGEIDILKIDIESLEEQILRSLSPETVSKIKLMLIEGEYPDDLFVDTHDKSVYGPVTRFTRKAA